MLLSPESKVAVVIGFFDPLRDSGLKLGQPELLLDFCCNVFRKQYLLCALRMGGRSREWRGVACIFIATCLRDIPGMTRTFTMAPQTSC